MAGLDPAIHAFLRRPRFQDMDALHKAGYEGGGAVERVPSPRARPPCLIRP
jgi:hypothetical protein